MDFGLFRPRANVQVAGGPPGLPSWLVVPGDPNGIVAAPEGTLAYLVSGSMGWQNRGGGTVWRRIGALATPLVSGDMSAADKAKLDYFPPMPPVVTPLNYRDRIVAWWSDEDLTAAGALASFPSRMGGGLTADQATAGNRPLVLMATAQYRTRLRFVKATPTWLTVSGLVRPLLADPAPIFSTFNSYTVLVRFRATDTADCNLLSMLSANFYGGNSQFFLQPGSLVYTPPNGGVTAATLYSTGTDMWAAYVYERAVGHRLFVNGNSSFLAAAALIAGDKFDKFGIGATVGGLNAFDGSISEMVVMTGTLSEAEMLALQPYWFRGFSRQVFCVGNSLASRTALMPSLRDYLPSVYAVQCPYAVGGAITEQLIAALDPKVAPQLLPMPRLMWFYEWGNSIKSGSTLASLRAMAAQVKAWAAAHGCKLMTATITERVAPTAWTAPEAAVVAQVNADMKANPSTWSDGVGCVVDLAAVTAGANTDGTHWDTTRAAACARSLATHVTALWGEGGVTL